MDLTMLRRLLLAMNDEEMKEEIVMTTEGFVRQKRLISESSRAIDGG
jgi:hypothetical protein